MNLLIRPATEADGAAICDVHKRSIVAGNSRFYTPEQIEAWSGRLTPEWHQGSMTRSRYFVATEQEAVVGFAILHDAEILAVYADPVHYRGGVGRSLMERLESEAKAAGLAKLTLDASLSAIPFYEKMGYQQLHPTNSDFGTGVLIPGVLMEKQL